MARKNNEEAELFQLIYPDLVTSRGLHHILNDAFRGLNSPLTALGTDDVPFAQTRIENRRRFSQIYLGAGVRSFLCDFWSEGACVGHLSIGSVQDLARALHLWNAEMCQASEMRNQFPNFKVNREVGLPID